MSGQGGGVRVGRVGGIGFVGALTITFVVLRLLGEIDWSWWWVLSPVLITGAWSVVCIVVLLELEFRRERKRRAQARERAQRRRRAGW